MTAEQYAAFLPIDRRPTGAIPPQSSWWSWREHTVHVARARNSTAAARIVVVHGAGGHSGALWPVAAQLIDHGLDIAAVDLPLYGLTRTHQPELVRYDGWVQLLVDFVDSEADERPLILLGASIGGLLACEVAARSRHVTAVAATCLLNPQDPRALARMTRFGPLGLFGGVMAPLTPRWLERRMIGMNWVAKLSKMSRNPGLSRLCAIDPMGGAARVPIGFLTSYLRYRHHLSLQMTTPVTLVHPAKDSWTPVGLSVRYLQQMAAPTQLVLLRECGHFPIEEPGLTDLVRVVADLAKPVRSR